MPHLIGSYSDTCILHIKTDTLIIDFKAKADFTGKREFTGIGEEVSDNLRNAVPVFFNNQVFVLIIQNKDNPFLHTILMNLIDIPTYFTQVHRLSDVFQCTGFYLRQVQDVINQLQQDL